MTRVILAFATIALISPGLAAAQLVKIETNKGEIIVELNAKKAPISVANFLSYMKKGHYDGTIFHRVIPKFMIQGGGFDQKMNKKPTDPPIKLESNNGLTNKRGTLAMARTQVKDSATSQFFINHQDNPRLDSYNGGYAVFGKVKSGMDIVDAIAMVPTARQGGHANMPTEMIIISKISLVERKGKQR